MKKIWIAGRDEQTKNYQAAVRELGAIPVVTLNPAESADCVGLIMPGGADVNPARYGQPNTDSRDIDDALDQSQLEAIRIFVEAKKPILGICRGHQILNVYFGGTLIQNLDHFEIHQASGSDNIHPTHVTRDCFLNRLYGSTDFVVNSSHHQAVDRLGEGLIAIQYADNVVEGMIHESLPIISLQWHPERMCFAKKRDDTVDGSQIFRHFLNML